MGENNRGIKLDTAAEQGGKGRNGGAQGEPKGERYAAG
jgi:hypothetical protein